MTKMHQSARALGVVKSLRIVFKSCSVYRLQYDFWKDPLNIYHLYSLSFDVFCLDYVCSQRVEMPLLELFSSNEIFGQSKYKRK